MISFVDHNIPAGHTREDPSYVLTLQVRSSIDAGLRSRGPQSAQTRWIDPSRRC